MKPKILKWGAAVMIAAVAVALAADITFSDLNPTDTDTFLDLQRKWLAAVNANTTAVNANGGGGSSTNFPNGLQFGDGSGGTVILAAAGDGFWFGTLVSGVETVTHVLASGSGNVALVNGATFIGPILGAATATSLAASGAISGNGVNSTGSGEGVHSLTNAAGTQVYREAPSASMTGNVFHRHISAAATGFYFGTAAASTNENDSIKASVDLSTTDASGILAAARFPALTGDVTTSSGAIATTIANAAVSNAKMANMAQGTIKARASAAGSGAPTDATALPWAFTGDVTSVADANALTLASVGTAGTYRQVTTDAKGRVTSGSNSDAPVSKTANYTILTTDSSTTFDVNGAAGNITFTLPASPTAGLFYTFITDNSTLRNIVLTTGTTVLIRQGASVTTATTGTVTMSTNYQAMRVKCVSATLWVVEFLSVGTVTFA